jgi:hypothetical protein
MVSKLSTKHYLVDNGSAVISVASEAALPSETSVDRGKVYSVTAPDEKRSVEIKKWGTKNDLPDYREELVTGNNIVPALIERKRNIICGQGWYAYRERFEDGPSGAIKRVVDEVPMPAEAEAFFKKFTKEARRITGDLLKHKIAIVEFIRNGEGHVGSNKALDMKYCRAQKKDKAGNIPAWWWSNYWTTTNSRDVKADDRVLRELPLYTGDRKQKRFCLVLQDDLFNDGYYPIPEYWGGRHWINLSNIIPLFHLANLKHGAAPRFHIIIPHDYFYDYERMNGAANEEERAALLTEFQSREQAFIDDLNQVITSIGNTGRTLVTKSEVVEALGGKYDKRIQIEEIKFDMRDEALLELYKSSNIANVSAQALHPTLASIESSKGIGSGTEIRNAFLMYLIIAAPVIRHLLQEVVDLVKTENNWPADIKYAIRDAEMTTLAENPAGVQQADPNNQPGA